MQYILTPEEMKIIDNAAITDYLIPSSILMENAARSSSDIIRSKIELLNISEPNIVILCGIGNNGGDGFALARHLSNYLPVSVYWIGDPNKMSSETRTNFNILNKLLINTCHIQTNNDLSLLSNDYNIIIDSMIGIGGSEELTGIVSDILQKIGKTNAIKFAIDIPTGLNAKNGKAHNLCFKADYTITMYANKIGLLITKGPLYSGEIITADLGAPLNIIKQNASHFHYEYSDLNKLIPKRNPISSKFDYGRVVILAGSKQFPGAGALTSNAAIKCGSGLVELYTEFLHPSTLPEVICPIMMQDTNAEFNSIIEDFKKQLLKSNSIVIGPGLGNNIDWVKIADIYYSLGENCNLLIDADGIKAIDLTKKFKCKTILTPHLGEFANLIGIPRTDIESNSIDIAKEYALKLNCIIHLKSVPSVTTDGVNTCLTINGNPGMSTAGSGDVLSGIIAGLTAQGLETLTAASLGAYIHAGASSIFTDKYIEQNLTASDMIEYIKNFMSNSND